MSFCPRTRLPEILLAIANSFAALFEQLAGFKTTYVVFYEMKTGLRAELPILEVKP